MNISASSIWHSMLYFQLHVMDSGEIRSGGFHGVIEMQDGYIKSQVRRLVEGL
jgi:hypothetical protein